MEHLDDTPEVPDPRIPMRDGREPMGLDAPSMDDPWQIWFWRIVQIIGVLVFLEQVVVGGGAHPDRPWILIFSGGMMLGGYGMLTLTRALIRLRSS